MGELTEYLTNIACRYEQIWESETYLTPEVSIVIPAYNAEKYLEKCLESLLKQTFKNFEAIIVNDGSIDLTPEIANIFQHCDKRFKLITQKNKGLSGARNTGLCNAIGKYITFIDSDDYVSIDYIEKLYDACERNQCDIAVAEMIRKRKYSEKYSLHFEAEKTCIGLQEKIDICRIPACCYVCGKLFKTELIKGNLFKSGVYFEDVIWTPEILKKSNKLVVVPNIYYYYIVNPNSIVKSKQTTKKQLDSYNAKSYIVEFFENNNLKLKEKNKHVTKYIRYFLNIPVLKVKEYKNFETFYLFGFLPILKKQSSKYKYSNKTFLIFNTAAFGDVMICNSLIQNIKVKHPDSKIIFICNKSFEDVAKYQYGVDEVVTYDKKNINKSFLGFIKFCLEFKYKGAYASFICYRNERNFAISLLTGAKNIIILKRKDRKNCSINKSITNLFKELTNEDVIYYPIKYLAPDKISNDLSELIENKKIISFCPTTSQVHKDIPIETSVKLIKELNKQNKYKIVLTGCGDKCLKYRDDFLRHGCNFIDLVNKTTIPELSYILKKSKALITADTGTMHLGCAVDIPVLAIWYQKNTTDYGIDSNIYKSIMITNNQTVENILNNLEALLRGYNHE